jgi:flagellar hook-associated protein 3 FlgL
MTRISQLSLSRNVLTANQANLSRAADLQEQLASGKRVSRMSDDPIAGKRILNYRIASFESDRYIENAEKALSFQEASDSALTGMGEVLEELKKIAVKGANAAEDANSRRVLAQSAQALLERAVDLANTVHDGRHVFAGNDVLNRPFSIASDGKRVDYAGDLDTHEVRVSPSSTVTVNENGHTLFKDAVDVFAVFVQVRDALRADDPEGSGLAITDLDEAARHIGERQGQLGGRMQRIELTRNQLEETKAGLQGLVSQEQDADLAATISELQSVRTALEAGLNVGARVIQPTLLDFL